jgi:hypothetical protein
VQGLQNLLHTLPGGKHRPPEEAGKAAEERDSRENGEDYANNEL